MQTMTVEQYRNMYKGKRSIKGGKRIDWEHQEQRALFDWARYIPECKLMFAIPNGGDRHILVAKKLKAEGVKAGVPDIFLPVPTRKFNGLFIEMKSKGGRTSESQNWWLGHLNTMGYKAEVCKGFDQARETILNYLGLEDDKKKKRPQL
jgi:hypothetical protein